MLDWEGKPVGFRRGARARLWIVVWVAVALIAAGLLVRPSVASAESSVTDVPDPNAVTCGSSGLIDFENLPDQTDLTPQIINGVAFTTTSGFTWRVGDFATGSYNGRYPSGSYTSRGTHWAWLGENQGAGRMDLVGGNTSFFSLLVSANTSVVLEAYSSSNELLETAGPATPNIDSGHMARLQISRPTKDIAYVIVHDSGNYFLVDAICTDAPGVNSVGRYVALGDSYSSGEGVPAFQPRTDVAGDATTVRNMCHRSYGAYPRLIEGRLGIPQVSEHWACSGAIIADFYNTNHDNPGEGPQLDRLGGTPSDASLVTLTVGGNDIGFEGLARACLKTNAWFWQGSNKDYDPNCRLNLNASVTTAIRQLETGGSNACGGAQCSLSKLYRDLRSRASRAQIVVVGYPMLVPENSTSSCSGPIRREDGSARGAGANWSFTKENANWIASVITLLNQKIKKLATEAGLTYVDASKAFTGHEVCSADPWVNGVVLKQKSDEPSPFSFHPNQAGQRALADLVSGDVSAGGTDLYIRPGQTQTTQYAVDTGQASFTAASSWTGSDIGLTLTSPTGRTISRSTTDPDVSNVVGPNNETITVSRPEPGVWSVGLTGLDVPAVGEAARLRLSQRTDGDLSPIAVIQATPSGGVAPKAIQLDGSGSSVAGSTIDQYTWSFDDGTLSTNGPTVLHTFAEPGTHLVSLQVHAENGQSSTAQQLLTITATNQAPSADLLVEKSEGAAPLTVGFDATDSTDVDGAIVRYDWDFDGNGTSDASTTSPETSHTYDTAGSYIPSVTVTDDLGATGRATGQQVTVSGETTTTTTTMTTTTTSTTTTTTPPAQGQRIGVVVSGARNWSGQTNATTPQFVVDTENGQLNRLSGNTTLRSNTGETLEVSADIVRLLFWEFGTIDVRNRDTGREARGALLFAPVSQATDGPDGRSISVSAVALSFSHWQLRTTEIRLTVTDPQL